MILALELVKALVSAQNRVVRYEHGATLCPACEYCGLPPARVLVTCTMGEIRYCTCTQCDTTFRAAGDERKVSVNSPEPLEQKVRRGNNKRVSEKKNKVIKEDC